MVNIIIYIIFGWLIGEFFHITLWEWFKNKYKLDNKKLKTIFIFIGIALFIAIIGSGFYRVKSNENVILTTIHGNKIIKDSYGIKYSLLSSREFINMQKQIMKYPEDYSSNGYEIITSDEKPLLINSFLEYKIEDTYKWGIENKDSRLKLLVFFASNVKNTIQKLDYNTIKRNLKTVEEEIENELKKIEKIYGIKIINVDLQISDTNLVKQAKSNAESKKINSKSLKESYKSESEAIKVKYNSIEDKDFIKYMEFIKSIKNGNIKTILIPTNTNFVIDS